MSEDSKSAADVAGPAFSEGLGPTPPMTVDGFFAEAKRLNLRMLGTPAETRAALDLKDAEIARLRDALRHLVHNVKATGKRLDLGLALDAAEAALGPNP